MKSIDERMSVLEIHYGDLPSAHPLMSQLSDGQTPDGFPLIDLNNLTLHDDGPFVDRQALAAQLQQTNAAYNNPLSDETYNAIKGNGRFVIAGQQPGLAMGPALCLYKAMTAVALAEDLSKRTGEPIIPMFWIASEDHDIAEVNRLNIGGKWLVDEQEQLRSGGARSAVASVSPKAIRDDLIARLTHELPDSDHKTFVINALNNAKWNSYPSLFATLLTAVVGQGRIVLLDPMQMRKLAAPAMKQIVQHLPEILHAFTQGQTHLDHAGFKPPLDRVNLFEFVQGQRLACSISNDSIQLNDGPVTKDQLAKLIEQYPARFSPGAALRPILADMMLPNLCTIGGPTEMVYLWQIDPLYRTLNINRSTVFPRISLTVLDDRLMRLALRFGLDGASVFELLQKLANYNPADYDYDDDDVLCQIEILRDQLLEQIKRLDAGDAVKMVDKASQSIDYQVNKLTERLRENHLAKRGIGKSQLKQLVNQIMPLGQLQERTVSGLELIGRYGQRWMNDLINDWVQQNHIEVIDHKLIVMHEKGIDV